MLDSGAVRPGFKSQPRRCRVSVLGKLFTPIVPRVRSALSALTLLVGRQEGHPACKNGVVGCSRGYLSGARCRLADSTATHCLSLQ